MNEDSTDKSVVCWRHTNTQAGQLNGKSQLTNTKKTTNHVLHYACMPTIKYTCITLILKTGCVRAHL
jgi:hypothetical protein